MMASAQAYTQALAGLLPSGAAWRGKNLHALLGAWAKEGARVEASAQALLREINPTTASALLPDWERLLGITPAKKASKAKRRQVVLARLSSGVVINDASLANLARALGWRLEFEYFKPARSGKRRSGERNYKAGWVYAKRITGEATANNAVDQPTLRTTLTQSQPAHEAWLWALT